jgi:hypothetical protein
VIPRQSSVLCSQARIRYLRQSQAHWLLQNLAAPFKRGGSFVLTDPKEHALF